MFSHDKDDDFNVAQRIAAKESFFAGIHNATSNDLTWDVDKLGRINSEDLIKINVHLKQNVSITNLDLACNRLGENKEIMTLLVRLLEDNPQIKSVDLFLNFINTEALDIILQSQKLRPRLKDIDINFMSNIMDDDGFKKAIHYLSQKSIRSMLRGNAMIKDVEFVKNYRASITQHAEAKSTPLTRDISVQPSQSGVFSPSSKTHANSSTNTGKNTLSDSSNAREDKQKEQAPPISKKIKDECKEHTPTKKNSF